MQPSPDERRAALQRYDILDTPPEEAFDRFTEHAADLFDVPIALITLLDADRQWFKSCVGTDRRETGFDVSFCIHTIQSEGLTVAEDAAADDRFADNPLVTGEPGVRFYAGAPLETPDGVRIGTLCVLDTEPRSFSDADRKHLETLGAMVMDKLEDRRTNRRRERELRDREARYRTMAENFPNGVVALFNEDLEYELVRGRGLEESRLSAEAMEGRHVGETVGDAAAEQLLPYFHAALDGESSSFEQAFEGHLYRVHIVPVEGERRGIVMTQDITEEEKDRRQLETLIDTLPGFVYRHRNEPGWPLEFVKGQVEAVLGYTADEMQNIIEDAEEVIHPEDRDYVRRGTQEGLEESESYDLTYRVIAKDGQERWVRERGQIVEDPATGEALLDGFITDVTERRRAEKERRRSRDLLRHTEKLAEMGGWEIDLETESLRWTAGTHRIHGTDKALTPNVGPATGFYHPDDRSEIREALRRCAKDGEPYNLELRLIRADGEERWIHTNGERMRDPDGSLKLRGAIQDITERKTAYLRLEEREERLRGIADSIPGVVYRFRTDPERLGTIEYASEQSESLLGLSPDADDLLEQVLAGIPEESRRNGLVTLIREAAENEEPWDWEFPYEKPSGERVWLHATAHPTRLNGTLVYHGVLLDITERKQAERQRRVLAEAIEQAGEGILITEAEPLDDPGPRIVYANPALEAMTGYAEDELLGRTPRLLQGPQTDRAALDSLREALEREESWSGETINHRKDGTPYALQWSVAPVQNGHGDTEYWVSVQRDVTDRRRREEALREAKEDAEAAAELKEALLANVTHELRTPLTSMIGFSEMLAEQLDDSQSEFAELIQQSGNRLKETLDAVIELSKLEGGGYEITLEPVCLNETITTVAQMVAGKAEAAGLDLRAEPSADPVRAAANPSAVQRVLMNLMDNAIKFTPEGGSIWIRTVRTDEDARVEIEDTGIGISDDALPDVFKAFKQESAGYARDYEGCGLGLSIAHELTKRMNGRLDIESEKGVGTLCTVRLPLADGDSQSADDS